MNTTTERTDITDAEVEASIAFFQSRTLKFFPYVYIPQTTSAQQLRATRPFLVMCMAVMSTRPTERQRDIFETVKKTLAQKVVTASEPSIDLLLGLLTILGW